MIVDSSAIVAIWDEEPSKRALSQVLLDAGGAKMSAATYVEMGVVIDNRSRPERSRSLDSMLRAFGIEVVPFTPSQAVIARAAYRDFGKGSGHPAHLNMGDCFSYALASEMDEPLLFVGDDFTHTDVRAAWRPEARP